MSGDGCGVVYCVFFNGEFYLYLIFVFRIGKVFGFILVWIILFVKD